MNENIIHILFAEDDEDDRNLFRKAIESLEIKTEITTVNDGESLMTYLNKEGTKLPDLIFLDLNMPRRGGMYCLKKIRSSPKFKDIPVAIYSTSAFKHNVEGTFKEGANIYIKKPNDFEEIKKVIAEIVSVNWRDNSSVLELRNFLVDKNLV